MFMMVHPRASSKHAAARARSRLTTHGAIHVTAPARALTSGLRSRARATTAHPPVPTRCSRRELSLRRAKQQRRACCQARHGRLTGSLVRARVTARASFAACPKPHARACSPQAGALEAAARTLAIMPRQGSSLLKLLKFGAAALKPTKLADGRWLQAAVSAKAAARLRKAALLEGKCVSCARICGPRAAPRAVADGRTPRTSARPGSGRMTSRASDPRSTSARRRGTKSTCRRPSARLASRRVARNAACARGWPAGCRWPRGRGLC